MSLKLLEMAVQECSEGLPEEHFLRQPDNIEAVKNMIMGVTAGVEPGKTWLYTIVNNRQSGMCQPSHNALHSSSRSFYPLSHLLVKVFPSRAVRRAW